MVFFFFFFDLLLTINYTQNAKNISLPLTVANALNKKKRGIIHHYIEKKHTRSLTVYVLSGTLTVSRPCGVKLCIY